MDKIKVGFIGTGMMGRNHIKTVAEQYKDVAEITGICDTSSEELSLARKESPSGVSCFSDYREIIKDKRIQAVFISLPNFLHSQVTIDALKAGKDVFCEKPVATKAEDIYRMLEAKEKAGRILMIGLELRYSDYYARIKGLIEEGVIGRPVMAWCKEFRGPFLPKIDNWIQHRDKSGGAMVDKNSHHFDLMTWYLNAMPLKVVAFGGKNVVNVLGKDDVEDNAFVTVEYEGGLRASLSLCMFAPSTADNCLEIGLIGDKGRLETEEKDNLLHLWSREKPEDIRWNGRMPRFVKKSEHTVYKVSGLEEEGGHSGFLQEHKVFFDAVSGKGEPLTSIQNVLYSTLIPIAAEESIRTGEVVEIR
jgi:myo-inositol 2-dehydrogenase / D-chiro-inositol 1-dehydrogenase